MNTNILAEPFPPITLYVILLQIKTHPPSLAQNHHVKGYPGVGKEVSLL